MLKDVVVNLSGATPQDFAAEYAVSVAKTFGAHVTGIAFVYEPVIDERQARRRALRHLVRRMFDGSPSLLVLNVLEDEELDPAEREQLRKLIERT